MKVLQCYKFGSTEVFVMSNPLHFMLHGCYEALHLTIGNPPPLEAESPGNAALCSMADSPWPEAHRGGRPITETWLGHRLRRFGIRSQTLRFEDQLAKGYERADFKEAFRRFLGESGQVDRTG